MTRWVLHVDLDQFIAAVEVLRHPELRGRPVVVGGDGDPAKRGVVSTASYEARAFGVHSGLALRTARRRCPDAVFLPVDAGAYEAASAEVMADAAPYVPRSHGQEITFQHDITDWEQVRNEVTRLARQVAAGIAGEQRPVRRVVVKVRYAPFITRTHGQPLPAATSDAAAIERAALAALGRFTPGRPVRLLGVRAEFTR